MTEDNLFATIVKLLTIKESDLESYKTSAYLLMLAYSVKFEKDELSSLINCIFKLIIGFSIFFY